ncbi:MAG: class I SAM-dependent methyltransferase, partial [Bacteroidetes bacterium]
DISKGLLTKAQSRFINKGFKNLKLYNASADDLPFSSNTFDFAICNLSLNFFDNLELFTKELRDVLKINSTFFCSVPIPERKPAKSKIRGVLSSEVQLILNFEKYGFEYVKKPYRNGAVLYFAAVLKEK